MNNKPTIAIIGGGSWATALVKILSNNVDKIFWWVRSTDTVEFVKKYQHNPNYLSDVEIDLASWKPQPVFGWLAKAAGITEAEMLRTFNCGIGLIAIASEKSAGHVIDAFQENGDRATRLGALVGGDGEPKVRYTGALRF